MEWQDQGVLLSARRHGENAAIIEVFTQHHGRHAGVVHGGASRRMAPILQPGAELSVTWRARLEDHIGTFRVEPIKARAALIMGDRMALAGLNAICALLKFALPERAAHEPLYDATEAMLLALTCEANWPHSYVLWELTLLAELGFGLDLACCAVTGARNDLAYVSPRTGRAVSRAGAGVWADRLLPYPSPERIVPSLATTGFFLEHSLAHALGAASLPAARGRLLEMLEKGVRPAGAGR